METFVVICAAGTPDGISREALIGLLEEKNKRKKRMAQLLRRVAVGEVPATRCLEFIILLSLSLCLFLSNAALISFFFRVFHYLRSLGCAVTAVFFCCGKREIEWRLSQSFFFDTDNITLLDNLYTIYFNYTRGFIFYNTSILIHTHCTKEIDRESAFSAEKSLSRPTYASQLSTFHPLKFFFFFYRAHGASSTTAYKNDNAIYSAAEPKNGARKRGRPFVAREPPPVGNSDQSRLYAAVIGPYSLQAVCLENFIAIELLRDTYIYIILFFAESRRSLSMGDILISNLY